MIILDGTIDDLRHFKLGKISTCCLGCFAHDLECVDRVLGRTDGIQDNPVADLSGELQTRLACRGEINRNGLAHGLPRQADIVEMDILAVIGNLFSGQKQTHRFDIFLEHLCRSHFQVGIESVNPGVALGAGARRQRHATARELVQASQALGHHHRTAQAHDLGRAQDQSLRRQTDGRERRYGIAHQLNGLRKKTHLVTALFRLLHEACQLSHVRKLAVSQSKTCSRHFRLHFPSTEIWV